MLNLNDCRKLLKRADKEIAGLKAEIRRKQISESLIDNLELLVNNDCSFKIYRFGGEEVLLEIVQQYSIINKGQVWYFSGNTVQEVISDAINSPASNKYLRDTSTMDEKVQEFNKRQKGGRK